MAIVESFYAEGADDAWLRQVLDGVRSVFDFGWGLGFALIKEESGPRELSLVNAVGAIDGPYQTLQHAGMQLPREAYQAIYRPLRPLTRASHLAGLAPEQRMILGQAMGGVGFDDAVWMVGFPTPGYAFQLGAGIPATVPLSLRKQDKLHRLRIHLDAALRLRLCRRDQRLR